MTNANSGRVGVVVGALILCGAFVGCVDNGNDVGFEELPNGAGPSNVATTASGGSAYADAAVVTTGSGGGGDAFGDAVAVTTGGADPFGNVVTTGSGGSYSMTAVTTGGADPFGNVVTTGSGGSYGTTAVTTGGAFGNVVTTGSGGSGGAPAETLCGPEELELHCGSDEICRGVQTFGPVEYSCQPNPCFEHDQANSCECAASLCGAEAPNCVMAEDDTVVACVCVLC